MDARDDPELTTQVEWGFRLQDGRIRICMDEFWARRESAFWHGSTVVRRTVVAGEWEDVG